jgi:hypothetical protein
MGLPESDFNMSTFHSLALDIVKEHCKEVFGWNDFRIGNMTPSMLVPKFFNENSHYLSGISDDDKEKIQKYLLKKLNILLRNNKYVKWLDNNSNTSISLSPIDKLLDYIDLDEEASKVYKKCKDTIKKTDDPSKIKELLEEYDISILPLHVILGEKDLLDGVIITPDEIYEWADASKTTPKTSAPSIEDAIDLFKPYVENGDSVIYFSISKEMSTSINVINLAADELEATDKIFVIDSANLSTGVGHLVLKAATMAKEGIDAETHEAFLS